jgi:hypothetical protein
MRWLRRPALGPDRSTSASSSPVERNDALAPPVEGAPQPARRFDGAQTSILCSLRSVVELSLVESVLAGAGIPYGTAGQSGFGSLHAVTLFVRRQDLPEARELLASLELPTEVTPSEAPAGGASEPSPAADETA